MGDCKRQLNNKGFTLIEIIVASAVSVVVILTVMTFISISLREFKSVNVATTVQNEAQIAQSQVGKLIIESVDIKKDESTTKYDVYTVNTGTELLNLVYDVENRRLLIDNADTEGQTIEQIISNPKKTLMASNINEFSLSPQEINCNDKNAIVEVKIVIGIDNKSTSTIQKYALRNGTW